MVFLFRRQPLRSFYGLCNALTILFIRLPVWMLTFTVPSWRPVTTWTMKRSLAVTAFRAFVHGMFMTALVPLPYPKEDKPDPKEPGIAWADPVPDLIVGEISDYARANQVDAVRTPGFWYGPRGPNGEVGQKASPDEKVIYHFHGGGFVLGTSRPSNKATQTLFSGFSEHFSGDTRIFALEFRLASTPPLGDANHFPAAFIDAITGYHYLVHDLGFAPANILLEGNSAGGLLAFSLARYLVAYRAQLPAELGVPCGVLMSSPTLDWAASYTGPDASLTRNFQSDYTDRFFSSGYSLRALAGQLPLDLAATSAWTSPGARHAKITPGMFAGVPRTCIVSGGAEIALDAIRAFRARLEADVGTEGVTYIEVAGAAHDFLTVTWCEPERTNALREVATWAREVWAA
ncbi:predicted protein [Postia placenta Mad-698-R]|nr:predicted protein [Postia placenta Mad-698-R]